MRKDHPRDEEVASFMRWAGEDLDPNLLDRHGANVVPLGHGVESMVLNAVLVGKTAMT